MSGAKSSGVKKGWSEKCKTWSDDSMKVSLKAVENGQSVSGAARDYGIPKMTLFDRVSGRVIHGVKPGPRPYLSPREEDTLGHFLKHCAKLGYGKGCACHCRVDCNR